MVKITEVPFTAISIEIPTNPILEMSHFVQCQKIFFFFLLLLTALKSLNSDCLWIKIPFQWKCQKCQKSKDMYTENDVNISTENSPKCLKYPGHRLPQKTMRNVHASKPHLSPVIDFMNWVEATRKSVSHKIWSPTSMAA